MTSDKTFEYARDDFNYPRFAQKLLRKGLDLVIAKVQASNIDAATMSKIKYGVAGVSMVTLLFGSYLITSLFVAMWLFIDQVQLHVFIDRTVASNRFRHFIEEVPLILALTLHLWLQGHWWTGGAALLGIVGLYLLTNLQMKYDLNALDIPHLYFLRWDRMGILFLFTLLGAWPGERAYLFVILLAWLLAALSFYDYTWILIQLTKTKK